MAWWTWLLVAVGGALAALVVYDLVQREHTILRNFPLLGHFRYWLESVGPELRQYIVTGNDSERPFSRDERRWVYASSKRQNNLFGFGTDNDLETSTGYPIVKHATFPLPEPAPWQPGAPPDHAIPAAKVLGASRGRRHAFRPPSIVNISSMSYGSLSGPAVEALNRGAALAGCLQGTGEGGLARHHDHGGDLIWQIGTGYFGCRDADGEFSLQTFRDTLARHERVRAIEVKLSQGAKPGLGGILPAGKVTREVAEIRGVPQGVTCHSPPGHSAFRDADGLLDFVELLAAESGLPVGIKSAVGDDTFWTDLARLMTAGDRGVDFVVIDGGEGGTGAGPLAFTDHVALPFKVGFSRVHRVFAEHGIAERVVWAGSGRLGLPEQALIAFALGCDVVNVGREAMMSIGCIQAQRCHTGHCPTGVTTSSRWLSHGLDPQRKAQRCADYLQTLRREILWLARACGVLHPALVTAGHLEVLDDRFGSRPLAEVFGCAPDAGLPSTADQASIARLMSGA